jgi:predicted ATP-grasp superfamily ATP-dependent carboligase
LGDAKAIVVGGYVNGLGLVRALTARGVRTSVVTTQPFDIAHHSRWASSYDSAPDLDTRPEQLVDLLERRAPEWRDAAIFPTNDGALAALAEHHERLSSSYRVIAPPTEIARYFLDKELMTGVARTVGIDVPICYGPATDVTAARSDLEFPVLVKPNAGHRFFSRFGCKLFHAGDRNELARAISMLVEAGLAGQVIEFIPGSDDRIFAYATYIDSSGEPHGGVTVRKLRQSPPHFGVARVAEIAPHDDRLRDATLALVRHLGFRGIATAEFKLDPRDGRCRFIEINGRSVVYNALLRRAGLDTAALAWSEHVTGHAEPAISSDWRGTWIHLHADLLYSILHRRQDPISLEEFLAPYRRPKVFAVWSARDPRPFLSQWSRTASAGVTALARGRVRELLKDRASPTT